jgi:hypothetical protein
VALQQSLDGATQIRITAAHRVEKAGALDRVAVECLLKYRLDAVPSRDIHAQRPCISLYSQARAVFQSRQAAVVEVPALPRLLPA